MRSSVVLPAPLLSIALGAAAALADVGGGVPVHPNWQNALAPRGAPGPEFVLAQEGRTDTVILVPAAPTPQDEKAAAELAAGLGQATGATFAVVREGTQVTAATCLSIGRTRRWQQARLTDADADLAEEGYAIGVAGRDLFLWGGRSRGAINAVFAFLEEDLGLRWYARGGSATVPARPTLAVRPVPRRFVPRLRIRDPFYWDAFDGEWSLRNRTAAPSAPVSAEWGGYPKYVWHNHSFALLVPFERYFAEHPEYFVEKDGKRIHLNGQLCLTHPKVLEISVARVKEALRGVPDARYISVAPNDGGGYCECPGCKAILDTEGSASGPLLHFVNAIADAIATEFPQVTVSTLAYLDTFQPPRSLRPRPNVVIHLATDSHAWAEPFLQITETARFQAAMKGWAAIGAKVNIWDYTVNFSHYTVPMPNWQVVTPAIRFYLEHNAEGVMLQGAYQGPGAADGPQRAWVWGKQLWDPSLETQALMRDFVYGYFGAAAEPLWEYQMLLWRLWDENHSGALKSIAGGIRYTPSASVFSAAFLDRADELLAQAAELAKDGPPELRRRTDLAALPIAYTRLSQDTERLRTIGDHQHAADVRVRLEHFAAVARREKITHLAEGAPDLEQWLGNARRILDSNPNEGRRWQAGETQVLRLPAAWRFALDPEDVGEAKGWAAADFADAGWASCRTDLGCGWEAQGFAGATGLGWYRQRLDLPAEFAGKRLFLLFEAVDEDAWVYLNGTLACDHSCAKTGLQPEQIWVAPFLCAAGDLLRPQVPNQLAVRVLNRAGMGGIWKPVTLLASDRDLDLAEAQAAAKAAPGE
jgi:hypothetical protein